MSWLLFVLYVVLILIFIKKSRFFSIQGVPAWFPIFLFCIKVLFSFFLWAIYTFYYTDQQNADIYKYFNDANTLYELRYSNDAAFQNIVFGNADTAQFSNEINQLKNWNRNFNGKIPFNENRFMIRTQLLLRFISMSNIHIHQLFFVFLSFMGSVFLLKLFSKLSHLNTISLLLTVSFPSFLFWTSGALKESLICFGLGAFLYGLFSFLTTKKGIYILLGIAGFVIILLLKYFLALCILPALAFIIITQYVHTYKGVIISAASVVSLTLISIYLLATFTTYSNFPRILANKQRNAVNEATYYQAGSNSYVTPLKPELSSVLIHFPKGILYSIFKPYPQLTKNPFILLAMIENLMMMLILLYSLKNKEKQNQVNVTYLLFFLIIIGSYFGIIGLLTPVVGTLVRYRVVMFPLLIFSLFLITDTNKKSTLN